MKKDNVLKLVIVGVMFTLVNAVLVQQYRLNDVSNQLEISTMRADINTEFTNELMWLRVNDTYEATQDQLVSQGRIEGVVTYLMGGDKEILDNLWHEGYMRGLAQVDYEYDMLSESNFEKGYHAAMKDAFPHTEAEFINSSPRNVKENAIKPPEFDVINSVELKGNEEVIDTLNVKIKEVTNKQ
jgi:hypothetical protein